MNFKKQGNSAQTSKAVTKIIVIYQLLHLNILHIYHLRTVNEALVLKHTLRLYLIKEPCRFQYVLFLDERQH